MAGYGVLMWHTLCLGSPVYTVRTVTGRVRSTTLDQPIASGDWEKPRNHTPFLDGVYLVTFELEFFQDLEPTIHTDPFFTRPS